MKNHKKNTPVPRAQSDKRLATVIVASAASVILPSLADTTTDVSAGAAVFYPTAAVQEQQVLAYDLANTQENAIDKYFTNDYNYCDAKVLAAYWGEASPYDAKLRLGDKMLRWGPNEAQSFVPPARAQALRQADSDLPCSYEDGGYSWDDVLRLARFWGAESDLDAKYKMAVLLVDGRDAEIQADLQLAQ
jgi:hypothetical protein